VKFERLVLSDHVIFSDKGFFANTGNGEITATDADQIEGSIAFDYGDPSAPGNFSGTFSVSRCH
jgi:hypothetical protein